MGSCKLLDPELNIGLPLIWSRIQSKTSRSTWTFLWTDVDRSLQNSCEGVVVRHVVVAQPHDSKCMPWLLHLEMPILHQADSDIQFALPLLLSNHPNQLTQHQSLY